MRSLQLSGIKKTEEEFVACICDYKTPAHGASLRNVLDVFRWLVHSCVTRAGAKLPEKLIQWFHCDEPWKVPGISCCAAVRFVGQACNISCPPLCGFFNPWKLEVRRRVTYLFFVLVLFKKRLLTWAKGSKSERKELLAKKKKDVQLHEILFAAYSRLWPVFHLCFCLWISSI